MHFEVGLHVSVRTHRARKVISVLPTAYLFISSLTVFLLVI